MEEELDKEQVKKDLEFMAKNIVGASNMLKKIYDRINEIYSEIKIENKQVESKY